MPGRQIMFRSKLFISLILISGLELSHLTLASMILSALVAILVGTTTTSATSKILFRVRLLSYIFRGLIFTWSYLIALIILRRSPLLILSLRTSLLRLSTTSSTSWLLVPATSAGRIDFITLVSLRSCVHISIVTDGILFSSRSECWGLLRSSLWWLVTLGFLALGNPHKLLVFRFFLGSRLFLSTAHSVRCMLVTFATTIMTLILLRIHL